MQKEPAGLTGRWRTTVAGLVITTMAASGLLLTAAPAMADETIGTPSDSVVQDTTTEDTATAPDEAAPAEEPANPSEEPAIPADEGTTAAEAPAAEAPAAEAPTDPAASKTADNSAAAEVQVLLVPPGEEVVDKVEICHATSSYKNPYIINEPAADGDVSGHAGHTGPVFYPEIPKHTAWGDIIPPFTYDGGSFPGLNWDEEGQAIYENDCSIPEPPADPTMTVEATDCIYYVPPSLTVYLYGLQSNLDYRVTVSNQDGVVDVWSVPAGTVGDTSFTWNDIPGGTYTATFEQAIIAGEWEQVGEVLEVSVVDCPDLGVTAAATGCSTGSDGTADIHLTGLIPGLEYGWELTGDDYELSGTLSDEITSDTLDGTLDELPPGDYAFYLYWQGDDMIVEAQATFTIDPCPPVTPVTPVTPKPAALAATGADGTGGLLGAALIMIVLGAGALAFRGRRGVGLRED